MASVSELKKLSRADLNEFAVANGVADAADEAVYKDKEALAQVVSPKVTPEQLATFVEGKKAPAEPAEPAAPADPATTEPAVNDPALAPVADESQNNSEPRVVDGVRYFQDGDKVCAVEDATFVNLQESPAGFGDNDEEALADLRANQPDPAETPAAGDAQNNEVTIGAQVYYPNKESYGGERLGEVTSVSEDEVEVVWNDGSRRWFAKDRVRLYKAA